MTTPRALPDFETLVTLHRCDPIAFESVRTTLLRKCVDDAPPAHRPGLEKLIARMDEVRARAVSPVDAAVAAARLMVESVDALQNQFTVLAEETAALQTALLLKRLRNAR